MMVYLKSSGAPVVLVAALILAVTATAVAQDGNPDRTLREAASAEMGFRTIDEGDAAQVELGFVDQVAGETAPFGVIFHVAAESDGDVFEFDGPVTVPGEEADEEGVPQLPAIIALGTEPDHDAESDGPQTRPDDFLVTYRAVGGEVALSIDESGAEPQLDISGRLEMEEVQGMRNPDCFVYGGNAIVVDFAYEGGPIDGELVPME